MVTRKKRRLNAPSLNTKKSIENSSVEAMSLKLKKEKSDQGDDDEVTLSTSSSAPVDSTNSVKKVRVKVEDDKSGGESEEDEETLTSMSNKAQLKKLLVSQSKFEQGPLIASFPPAPSSLFPPDMRVTVVMKGGLMDKTASAPRSRMKRRSQALVPQPAPVVSNPLVALGAIQTPPKGRGRVLPLRRGRAGSIAPIPPSPKSAPPSPPSSPPPIRPRRPRIATIPKPHIRGGSVGPGGRSVPEIPAVVGDDGNLFYCHICKEVGEVVCCDGCPNVYHPTCIPEGDPSRTSLDNDDDPWYCPSCIALTRLAEEERGEGQTDGSRQEKSKLATGGEAASQKADLPPGRPRRRARAKRKCGDCQRPGGKMSKCKQCSTFLHFPSCLLVEEGTETEEENEDENNVNEGLPAVYCTSCRAEQIAKAAEEEAEVEKAEKSVTESLASNSVDLESKVVLRRGRRKSGLEDFPPPVLQQHLEESHSDSNAEETEEEEAEQPTKRKYTKKKPLIRAAEEKKKKRKKTQKLILEEVPKKKRKRSNSVHTTTSVTDISVSSKRPVKATPTFFFFLVDNRPKIEKILSKNCRKFKYLSKGLEKNELIAKEGAVLWSKMNTEEKMPFQNASMKDFEERVIAWKMVTTQHRNRQLAIQNAAHHSAVSDSDSASEDRSVPSQPRKNLPTPSRSKSPHPLTELTDSEHRQTLLRRANKATTIKCPEKAPRDGGCNRVLLELLQDSRFHPIPMVHPNRAKNEFDFPDFSKMTVPYFEVQGPVATGIGDECLGCTRGWCHFCPIVKRHLPAVEHRSKLQPPLSTLMATRVGLGTKAGRGDGFNHDVMRSGPLSQPGSRADDIVQFIEEAVAMKIPDRENGSEDGRGRRNRRSIALHPGGDDGTGITENGKVYECGHCGATIHTFMGCVGCRRALLVTDMAKRQPVVAHAVSSSLRENTDTGTGFLKLQTVMLGRAPLKGSHFDKQGEGDKAIAAALSGGDWKPNAIMPSRMPILPGIRDNRARFLSPVESFDSDMSDDSEKNPAARARILISSSISVNTSTPTTTASKVRPGRRQRSRGQGLAAEFGLACPDMRQAMAVAHKIEVTELHKKCLSIATCSVLLGLLRRDPLRLFAEPVPLNVDGYHKAIARPMDFKTIRAKVMKNEYTSLGAFVHEARLLCKNSIAYNPPGSIYFNTAGDMLEALEVMQKRACNWITVIKNTHGSSFSKRRFGPSSAAGRKGAKRTAIDASSDRTSHHDSDDPFFSLRFRWPGAVELLDDERHLRSQIKADFIRTRENEGAYYGCLAVRRAAAAAAASIAHCGSGAEYDQSVFRTDLEDEILRGNIDDQVARLCDPIRFLDEPGWREGSVLQILRQVQKRRVEGRIASQSGCARCDGASIEEEAKLAMTAEAMREGKGGRRKDGFTMPRVSPSRSLQNMGIVSSSAVAKISEGVVGPGCSSEAYSAAASKKSLSVRGSGIHGWGLFSDHPFKKNDVVAEYVGEYISNPVADTREKIYQERRIQDYQFRVSHDLVIDATLKGGHARYINHNCNPNCAAKIIDGDPPNINLKRVIIQAQRDILAMEEITYDYQFPLELDLDARIPCNCGSDLCRGFMNWDLPEKGSNRSTVARNLATVVEGKGSCRQSNAGIGRFRNRKVTDK